MGDYYSRFSSEILTDLKHLNEDLDKERSSQNPNKQKIAKLYQQILMRGLEMGAGPMGFNNKPYR